MNEANIVARAVRVLVHNGVMHMSGHVALRDAVDPNVLWINSRNASRSTVTARDIVAYDIRAGKRISGDEEPSEVHMHAAIFARRPDLSASMHTHPEHVVALSIAGIPLRPVFVSAAFLPETVPTFDDSNLINTRARGELVADALGEHSAVVLRGHGVIVTGNSIDDIIARSIMTEENARLQLLAVSVGTLKPIAGEELERARRDICTPHFARKHANYHEETARVAGALP